MHLRLRIAAICWWTAPMRARGAQVRSPRTPRVGAHSLGADRCYPRTNNTEGTDMPSGLITRRNALLAGAGAVAAPFIITTPGFGQTGPIRIAGLVSLTGSGSPFGPNNRAAHQAVVDQVNAAGGLL